MRTNAPIDNDAIATCMVSVVVRGKYANNVNIAVDFLDSL